MLVLSRRFHLLSKRRSKWKMMMMTSQPRSQYRKILSIADPLAVFSLRRSHYQSRHQLRLSRCLIRFAKTVLISKAESAVSMC